MTDKKFNILIIDDNSKNLQILGNLLEKNNYNVEYALNGKDALKWINIGSFDLSGYMVAIVKISCGAKQFGVRQKS